MNLSGCLSKKAKNNRPLSPHISIYKPQITSSLSILHRIAGVLVFLGVLLLVGLGVTYLYNPDVVKDISGTKWVICTATVAAMGWSFFLFFHFFAEIRHLFWDAGFGFEIKTYRITGVAVILASIVVTISFWLLIL